MKELKLVINNSKKKDEKVFFVRKEFKTILNLYAKMVSNGDWKDYGLSTNYKEISFDIYQRASEKPVLRILKKFKPNYYNEKYLIQDRNGNVLRKSESLIHLIDKTSWSKLKLIK